jgi:hypothetical protein
MIMFRQKYYNIFCVTNNSKTINKVLSYILMCQNMDVKTCAYCGKEFSHEGWPHVEGDSNRGVTKIEQFCSEEHKYYFLGSRELT